MPLSSQLTTTQLPQKYGLCARQCPRFTFETNQYVYVVEDVFLTVACHEYVTLSMNVTVASYPEPFLKK